LIEEFNVSTGTKQVVLFPESCEDIIKGMGKRNSIAHPTTFIRAALFNEVGFYDPLYANEDYELWVRLLAKGKKAHNLQKVFVKMRISNDFYFRRKSLKRAIEVAKIKSRAIKAFSLSPLLHLYSIAHFVLFMSPSFIKKICYRYLRN